MSPVASAEPDVKSGTCFPKTGGRRTLRRAEAAAAAFGSVMTLHEGPIDDVHLLSVSRTKLTAYPETRIVRLGYFSGNDHIEQRVAIEHVDVHVEPGAAEERIEHRREIGDAVLGRASKAGAHE